MIGLYVQLQNPDDEQEDTIQQGGIKGKTPSHEIENKQKLDLEKKKRIGSLKMTRGYNCRNKIIKIKYIYKK